MFINFINSSSIISCLSFLDIICLLTNAILLIVYGSYMTIKGDQTRALGKAFSGIILYCFIIYIIEHNNLSNKWLPNFNYEVFDSVLYAGSNVDFAMPTFLWLMNFFGLIYLIVLYVNHKNLKTTYEYPLIVLLSIIGMIILLRTNDLFIWFLSIEFQSFCFYTLAAYRTNRSYLQTEAGLKYFFYGSLASAVFLFGLSLLYINMGTMNYESLCALTSFPMEHQSIFQISLIMIIISLFFKLGVAPFHFWVPTVYTYSSSIVTYLFILLPKIPLFYLLYKFGIILSSYSFYIPIFLSLFIGTLFAYQATNLKTFFAYGAIANTAFFLAPIVYHSTYSFYAFVFYMFTYNILITIVFLPILFLIRSDKSIALLNLRDLLILKKTNPILAIYYVLAVFSFAGIPPLLGFFSKLFVLLSALSSSAYLLVLILLFFSLISCMYYIRLVKIIYFSFHLKYATVNTVPFAPSLIISIFSFINLFFIVYPSAFALIIA